MAYLEPLDAQDGADNAPRAERLRKIPPETGRFLALLANNRPKGDWIEIGTSAGYSILWPALACQVTDANITTFEVLEAKA